MLLKLFLVIFVVTITGCLSFDCYSCQGGISTNCGVNPPPGTSETCEGTNAQCYESIKSFQNGASVLVERRCWVPDNKSTSNDYCEQFSNPVGKLLSCRICKDDLCNNSTVKSLSEGMR